MAVKKSELYSSLWASCDELQGGMDVEILTLDTKLTKAHQLKQSMIQKLLTGDICLL